MVLRAPVQVSMWCFVKAKPVSSKKRCQPMRSIHSPMRSQSFALFLYAWRILADHLGDLRPARRVVRQVRDDQLMERGLRAGIRVLAANPHRDTRGILCR